MIGLVPMTHYNGTYNVLFCLPRKVNSREKYRLQFRASQRRQSGLTDDGQVFACSSWKRNEFWAQVQKLAISICGASSKRTRHAPELTMLSHFHMLLTFQLFPRPSLRPIIFAGWSLYRRRPRVHVIRIPQFANRPCGDKNSKNNTSLLFWSTFQNSSLKREER